MPQLVKLQDELKDTGFALVAAHSQSVSQEQVTRLLKQHKVNFTVTSGANVPGNPVSGIPHAFIFDSSGKLVERGNPTGLKPKLHKLVETEPHFLAAGRKYQKLAALAESLKKTTAYGSILKKLEKDLNGSGPAAEEAKYLAGRITAHGEKLFQSAKKLETEDAARAVQAYQELAARYKGAKPGEQADARLKELKADKAFQEELKAAAMLGSILAECGKLVWAGRGEMKLDSPANKKVVPVVTAGAQALKKKFPGSRAAARVEKELAIYGIKTA